MLYICRLCLSTSYVNKALDDEECDLFLKIMCCLPVKPSLTDALTNSVCNGCEQKIENIYKYFNMIIRADNQLQSVLASGVDALNAFSAEIIKKSNSKEESEVKDSDITPVFMNELTSKSNLSKSTQTEIEFNVDNELMPEHKVLIKQEMENLKCELDFIPETEITYNEYDSDDDKTLINLASKSDIKDEPKPSEQQVNCNDTKKLVKRKCETRKLKVDTKVEIKTKSRKPNTKSTKKSKKDLKESEQNVPEKNRGFAKLKLRSYKRDQPENWQCLTCYLNLPSRLALLQHYKDHVENPEAIQNATDTDKNTDSSTVVLSRKIRTVEQRDHGWIHLDTGVPRPFQCLKCNKAFATKKYVRMHMGSHQVERPFVCNLCGHTFRRAYDIVLHSRTHSNIKSYHCKYEHCDYSSTYSGAISIHHRETHEGKFKYTCETCKKGFNVLTWFQEHQNLHTGKKPFMCDQCGKSFLYSRYLTSHRKICHPELFVGPKILKKCDTCGAEFSDRKRLKKHIVQEHAGEQLSYLCDICGKDFNLGHKLKVHRMRHLGVKPFVCKTCGKDFVRKYSLKNHEAIHSGEKPHVCGHCGKAFVERSLLIVHERYHTGARPFKCEFCDKAFVASNILCFHKRACIKRVKKSPDTLKSE